MIIKPRPVCQVTLSSALAAGYSELTAALIAGRVEGFTGDLDSIVNAGLNRLSDPSQLRDCDIAAERLVRAIADQEPVGIVTDYDVDGITSHALLLECLVDVFGMPPASVQSFIGHRLNDGYGLSDPVADRILAASPLPAVVITADCGSSDEPRLARLKAAGIDVIVTDHHGLSGDGPPRSAFATVNPIRDDCNYPDPLVAGCMVAWLLMAQLRRQLIGCGRLDAASPKLSGMLDLVSLGTVADAVSLFSPSNRAVVPAGLKVMNQMRRPCWRAVARLLNRERFSAEDLGFQLGPRINARGRMADPYAALRFLRATTDAGADGDLLVLDQNNEERKATEKSMLVMALASAEASLTPATQVMVVFDDAFHAGVQGIVASRLVEAFGRAAVVMSHGREDGLLTGSARSVPGLDIRMAIAEVREALPHVFRSFGGHKGAAGLTIDASGLEELKLGLRAAVKRQLGDKRLGPICWTDGALECERINLGTVQECEALAPFGREFEAPVFEGHFEAAGLRAVGDGTHLSLQLKSPTQQFRAIWFRARKDAQEPLPLAEGNPVHCAFRIERDAWRGGDNVQLVILHARPVAG